MERFTNRRADSYFDAWKRFTKKRARCKVLSAIVSRRAHIHESSKAFRNWSNLYIKTKAGVWSGSENTFSSDEKEVQRLTQTLVQAQQLAIEEMEREKEAEQRLAGFHGEYISTKLELDETTSRLHRMVDELTRCSKELGKTETRRLKKEESLAETKAFVKVLRDRPDGKKYSTINGDGDLLNKDEEPAEGASAGQLVRENLALRHRRAELERHSKSLKRAIVCAKKERAEKERSRGEERERREEEVKVAEDLLAQQLAKKHKVASEIDESREEVAVERSKVEELGGELYKAFDALDVEEEELKERLKVARLREEEVERLVWRRNTELGGLREEARGAGGGISESKMKLMSGDLKHMEEKRREAAREARRLSVVRCQEVKDVLGKGGYVYEGGEEGGESRILRKIAGGVNVGSSLILTKKRLETEAALHRMSALGLLENLDDENRGLEGEVNVVMEEVKRDNEAASLGSKVESLTESILQGLRA